MDSASQPLAAALAEARANGRPAYRIAQRARISRGTLSRIAAGHQRPHPLTAEAVARALDRDVTDLFDDLEDADAASAAA